MKQCIKMQKIVTDGITCYPERVPDLVINGDVQYYKNTTNWSPYRNNMQAIQNNFNLVVQQNDDLKQQIEQLNKKLTEMQEQFTRNKEELEKQLIETTKEIKSLDSNVATLSSRLQEILSFVSSFTRSITKKFIQVLTGTATIEQLEFNELNNKLLK